MTHTETTDDPGSLTLANLIEIMEQFRLPVVYYLTSKYLPDDFRGRVVKVPNKEARAGYDLVIHPDDLDAVREGLAGGVILRPMDRAEEMRRLRNMSIRVQHLYTPEWNY